MIFRRRRLPEELAAPRAAFLEVLADVEGAKAALTECMPTTRMAGRPLPDALLDYEAGLGRALARMPAWRRPPLESAWGPCEDGLREGLLLARRLREEAPELGGFEGLLASVESLIDPLMPFAAAERAFHELRT